MEMEMRIEVLKNMIKKFYDEYQISFEADKNQMKNIIRGTSYNILDDDYEEEEEIQKKIEEIIGYIDKINNQILSDKKNIESIKSEIRKLKKVLIEFSLLDIYSDGYDILPINYRPNSEDYIMRYATTKIFKYSKEYFREILKIKNIIELDEFRKDNNITLKNISDLTGYSVVHVSNLLNFKFFSIDFLLEVSSFYEIESNYIEEYNNLIRVLDKEIDFAEILMNIPFYTSIKKVNTINKKKKIYNLFNKYYERYPCLINETSLEEYEKLTLSYMALKYLQK